MGFFAHRTLNTDLIQGTGYGQVPGLDAPASPISSTKFSPYTRWE